MSPSEYQQLVEYLGAQFTGLDRRFERLERDLIAFRGEMYGFRAETYAFRDEMIAFRDGMVEFRREATGHLDAIYGKLERLEQEYQAVLEALRRIGAALVDDRRPRELLERAVAELRERLDAMQTRLAELERRISGAARA
jgi:chromosome segregation ATPase